nr:MAG TPA: hypothetical protein [Caudoviricetes sp.]
MENSNECGSACNSILTYVSITYFFERVRL